MRNSEKQVDNRALDIVGERFIKSRILERIQSFPAVTKELIGGLGHDAGILNNPLGPDDKLLINTDKSGVSKAYKLGLAGGECIGDFAVSHAVSDILATGGEPFAVSVALMLPGDTTVGLVDEILDGILQACADFNVTLTGGDTKKADTLSVVVTALGRAPSINLLYRNTPQPGDQLVVSGVLGSMLLGSAVFKRGHAVSEAVRDALVHAQICQRPPFRLALEMSRARVANACTDISDGLQAACRNMISGSSFGVELDEIQVPVHPELKGLANTLALSPLQLSMAGGDWQFLYCVPKGNIATLGKISDRSDTRLTVIGEVIESGGIWAKTREGHRKKLRQIEHDSFLNRINGVSYFDFLSDPQELFE